MATTSQHCTAPTGAPGGNWTLINTTDTSVALGTPDDSKLISITDDKSGETSHLTGFDWSSIPAGAVINSVSMSHYSLFITLGAGTKCTMGPRLYLGANFTAGALIDLTTTLTLYTDSNLARPGGGSWAYADLANIQAVMFNTGGGTSNKINRCDEFYVTIAWTPAGFFVFTYVLPLIGALPVLADLGRVLRSLMPGVRYSREEIEAIGRDIRNARRAYAFSYGGL